MHINIQKNWPVEMTRWATLLATTISCVSTLQEVHCVPYSVYCGTFVHVFVASLAYLDYFGDTVLHVCVPKCHGHVCKSVVMMSYSQRVCI